MTPDEFIHRMLVLFGSPDTADDEIFIGEHRAVIGTASPRVLDVAFSIIRDEHEFKSWPVPAVVRKAIATAAHRVNGPPRLDSDKPQNPRANASPESRERVAALVANALGAMGEEGGGAKPKYPFAEAQRLAFEEMQIGSANLYMHIEQRDSRNARNA